MNQYKPNMHSWGTWTVVSENSVYSHWGIKWSSDKLRIVKNERGRWKTKRAPWLPIKPMLENRVYTCGQHFLILKPRIRWTHPGTCRTSGGRSEKNVYFLLAAWLPEERERKKQALQNDQSLFLPQGDFEGGRGRPELCWESLYMGGNILPGDPIFLSQLYKTPAFLKASKFGSGNSY